MLVAVVQADLHRPDGIGHGGITVQSSETQLFYQSTRQITVAGSGFQDHIKASIGFVFVMYALGFTPRHPTECFLLFGSCATAAPYRHKPSHSTRTRDE